MVILAGICTTAGQVLSCAQNDSAVIPTQEESVEIMVILAGICTTAGQVLRFAQNDRVATGTTAQASVARNDAM
jgi:hypothetical protein